MYDELVKSIHCCFGFDSMQTDCENCMMKDKRKEYNYVGCCDALMLAAVEAIEELSKLNAEITKRELKLRMSKPRWIPVTETEWLPPVEKEVFVTDGKHIAIANLLDEVFPGDKPCWSYSGLGEITHWCMQIQLPEPLKEG